MSHIYAFSFAFSNHGTACMSEHVPFENLCPCGGIFSPFATGQYFEKSKKMCPSLTLKSKKERPQESFQLINTSNLSIMYSTSLKRFQMDLYDVSSIDSNNRNVSDGKLWPNYKAFLQRRFACGF